MYYLTVLDNNNNNNAKNIFVPHNGLQTTHTQMIVQNLISFQAQTVREISMTVNLMISHVNTEPRVLMELRTTLVTAGLVTQDGIAMLTLMSVSLDSVRITQHVVTQSITTLVTVYQASRTSTVQQILMNVNQTLV